MVLYEIRGRGRPSVWIKCIVNAFNDTIPSDFLKSSEFF